MTTEKSANISFDPQVIQNSNCILVHYGEVALKGKNRFIFEEKLVSNIREKLRPFGVRKIERPWGRIVIDLAGVSVGQSLLDAISGIFGVVGFAPARFIESTLANIEETSLKMVCGRKFNTYAVRAKRSNKKLPFTSKDVNERVGSLIGEKFPEAKVNLDFPELKVSIEMTDEGSYVYTDKFKGPGGLPSGTGGRALCLISGGIDSPVAAWRMMKRGCSVSFLHFHSAPFTTAASIEKVDEIVENLSNWQSGEAKYAKVSFGELQKKIVTSVEERYRVILYRRFMMRLATLVAKEIGADALITGESLGQVASQTLSNMNTVAAAAGVQIFRPLIGMDKLEIIELAEKIGTYSLSIIPHQDCCQFLEPRNPVTRTTPEELSKVESGLDIEALVKEGLTRVEWADIRP